MSVGVDVSVGVGVGVGMGVRIGIDVEVNSGDEFPVFAATIVTAVCAVNGDSSFWEQAHTRMQTIARLNTPT